MSDSSREVPEADAAEQDAEAGPGRAEVSDGLGAPGPFGADGAGYAGPAEVPLEADAADAADQAREVRLDDGEDYR